MRTGARLAAFAVATATMALAGSPTTSAAPGSGPAPDPSDVVVAALRQVCDLQWIDGVCAATGYPDPQYHTDADPSPDQPLQLLAGAVHEHSGYSDGDPATRPEDYFRAGREGHNTADDGGDTGVSLDFMLSSEHSENEKLPITTSADCIDVGGIPDAIAQLELNGILPPISCSNVTQPDHYRKWTETLAQAIEATEFADGAYTGFTAMRGFEWTNDYFNHLGVYFGRNVVNAKIDGSYLTMDVFWNWLREPVERGGGSDALVVFNHPGGLPALSPFDGDLPHNQILADTLGGENWNDVAHVPDVDDRVVGMEVRGGDDLSYFVTALRNGWHIGPVDAEDEHQREWASTNDGKTLVLTRGRSPRDYFFAFQHHRTVAVSADVVGGSPGEPVEVPSVWFWAGADDPQDPAATVLGGVVEAASTELHLELAGMPEGAQAVLVSSALDSPEPLGTVGAGGTLVASRAVDAPAGGEDWWFVVACAADVTDCGDGEDHLAVTAPIWVRTAEREGGPTAPPAEPAGEAGDLGVLPETGRDGLLRWTVLLAVLAIGGLGVRRGFR